MLRCDACWCVSDTARGWLTFTEDDPDDGEGAEVATYCPPCAERELNASSRERGYV